MLEHDGIRPLFESDRLKVGTMVFEFVTPGIGHILKSAGADFAILDMEHGGLDFSQLKNALRFFEAANLPAIVRVPTTETSVIARALDIGADGIMAPMVGSAEQARAIVAAAKYHPLGRRGIAQQIGHDRYRVVPLAENLARGNRSTAIFVQIETIEGVSAADAIAAVDGVDGLWLGHGDLSASLGAPGDFSSPAFTQAVKSIRAAAMNHGKALGRLVPDVAAANAAVTEGYGFLAYSADIKLLHNALRSAIGDIRPPPGESR